MTPIEDFVQKACLELRWTSRNEGLDEAAQLCQDAPTSSHPTTLAQRIRGLKE